MKFSSVIVFALLSTVATTLATPISKRAASPEVQCQNGKDADALNQKFATLTANSPCTDGQDACVNGQFAQCSGGKFALSSCAGGTQCVALPLLNKPGTSVTCDTTADRDARISNAKAQCGSSSSSSQSPPPAGGAAAAAAATTTSSSAPQSCTSAPASSAPQNTTTNGTSAPTSSAPQNTTSTSTGGNDIKSIRMQNAADAIAQQNSFDSLTPNSPCTDGQDACVNGQFAQCSGGKFALSSCAGGTKCFALPLVNKKGTSVTCDTQADRDARIQAAQQGQA